MDSDWIEVPNLTLSKVALALPERSARIDALALSGLKAQCWLNTDGSVNLMQLVAPKPPDGSLASAVTPAVQPAAAASAAAPAAPARPWSLAVASVDVKGASASVEDRMQAPVKHFDIAPANLHVDNVSLDLAKPLPLRLDAMINGHALFKLAGTLTPSPLAADLKLSLDKASLKYSQPYVLPVADLTIHDGWLNFAGDLKLRPAGQREPEVSFDGGMSVDHFKSTDNTLNQDFVNFGLLQFQKIHYTLRPDALKIDRILVREPYARVIVSREQILNISAVMDPEGAAAKAQAVARRAGARGERNPGPEEGARAGRGATGPRRPSRRPRPTRRWPAPRRPPPRRNRSSCRSGSGSLRSRAGA